MVIPPVLGVIEGIAGIIFFIIAFMGFISNLTKQNQEKQRREQRRGGGGARDAMQDEIDAFLKESRRSPRDERAGRDEFVSDDEIEIVEEAPRRRPPRQRQRTRTRQRSSQGARQKSRKLEAPKPVPISETLEDRHIQSSFEGQEMPHLQAGIGQPAQVAQISRSGAKSHAKQAVFAMVRSGTGIRNAILVNEILSKPAALRKSPS